MIELSGLHRAAAGVAVDDTAGGPLRRLIHAVIGMIYAAALLVTYRQLSETWGYLGFWFRDPGIGVTVASIGAVGVLGAMLPARDWTVPGFAKWVMFVTLFIPALVIPPQQGVLDAAQMTLMEILIFVSAAMLIVGVTEGRPIRPIAITSQLLWQGLAVAWFVAALVIVIVFRGSLSFAGLGQVYEQRSAAAGLVTGITGYVLGLMSGAINPYLLIVGLRERRWIFVGMAIAGQLLVYATLAGKVVLGSTLLTLGVYFIFAHGRIIWTRVYAGMLGLAALGPVVSRAAYDPQGFASNLSDLIYLRILTLPGVLVGAYADFFTRFPVTYLSHSLIGRPFTAYPYGTESVGQVIGGYVTPGQGTSVNNYNANFIAADGIAGFGIWGVPLIMVIAALTIWLFSRLVGRGERAVTCAVLTPFVVSLADASIFTALLTGGGALAALLLYLRRGAIEAEGIADAGYRGEARAGGAFRPRARG